MTNAQTFDTFSKAFVIDEQELKNAINEEYFDDEVMYMGKRHVENSIFGKAFCITGTLSKKRQEIESIIVSYGGKANSQITKETDYLIVGEKPGEKKIRDAAKKGIKVISEDIFKEFIPTISENDNYKRELVKEAWKELTSSWSCSLDNIRAVTFTASSDSDNFLHVAAYLGIIRDTPNDKKTKVITSME
jgi:hypothetical protein